MRIRIVTERGKAVRLIFQDNAGMHLHTIKHTEGMSKEQLKLAVAQGEKKARAAFARRVSGETTQVKAEED